MLSLNDLPAELVVMILKGASLEDILHVTRSSSFLRSVGSSNRSLWADAQDAEMLPLPPGDSLDTVSVPLLSRLAARATALSSVWNRSVAYPLRSSRIPTIPFQYPTYHACRFSRDTTLIGNQWLLTYLRKIPHLYCLHSREYLPLDVEGHVNEYAYESLKSGSSITLATLKSIHNGGEYKKFLDVYVIEFQSKAHFCSLPRVHRAYSIHLPITPPSRGTSSVSVRGPLAVVSADRELFITNWKESLGLKLTPQLDNGPELIYWGWHTYFHPTLPLLIAEKDLGSHPGNSIHVIHLPPELPPFDASDLTDESLVWPTDILMSNSVYILEEHVMQYGGFRRNCGQLPIFDAFLLNRYGHVRHLSISKLDEPTPETSWRDIDAKGYNRFFERHTSTGRRICLRFWKESHLDNFPSSYTCSFLRFSDRSFSEEPWVRLKLPEGIDYWNVLAFDDVYGTLLFMDCDRPSENPIDFFDHVTSYYHIVQY